MVKVSYVVSGDGLGEVCFQVNDTHTLEEITDKVYDFVHETMEHNAINMFSDWPVYLKNKVRDDGEHIGYVRIHTLQDEVKVEHLTLDKKVINSDWRVKDFYSGKYGLNES